MLKTVTGEQEKKSSAYRSDVPESGTSRFDSTRETERRVRPDELADALRAIEERKQEVLPGTLPLEDTLEQLRLKVSADEVWQTVQEQRAVKATVRQTKRRSGSPRLALVAMGIVTLLSVGIAIRASLLTRDETMITPKSTLAERKPDIFSVKSPLISVAAQSIPYGFMLKTPTTRALSDIKEGEVLTLDLAGVSMLDRLVNGDGAHPPIAKSVADNLYMETKSDPNGFQVVRQGDKWYVRGWVQEKPVHKDDPTNSYLNGFTGNPDAERLRHNAHLAPVTLYNAPQAHTQREKTALAPLGGGVKVVKVDTGPAQTPIQIPIQALNGGVVVPKGTDHSYCDIAIDLTKMDERAYEPWK